MFNENFVREQYKEVLSELWKGSGYSLDSIRDRLDKDFTNGCDRAYDNSCIATTVQKLLTSFTKKGIVISVVVTYGSI